MLPCSSQSTCSCRTLTPTCPCHLFFRGFKTAVCPASNPPNASAGLQGNNSYSYMPLPSVFQGVQDCRLTGLKPSKRFRRPPRQQLLQLHAPAICFSGSSRLPFDRPETLQTLPQASEATTLTATCPAICFSGTSSLPFASPQNPPNAPLQLPIYMLLPNSYTYMPLPSVFQGVQDCRLPGLKPPKRFRRPPRQQLLQLHAPAICFSGSSRLPFDRPETFQTLPQASRQQLLQLHAPAICFSGSSRLPFDWPETLQTLPQASEATTLTATCPAICFQGVQACRLPARKTPQTLRSVFQGVQACRLPARKTPQMLPCSSQSTCSCRTLTPTCPCHLFFRGFKTAVCPASNPPNASAGLQGNNSYSYMPLPSVFQGVQDCRLTGLKPSKRFRRPPRQQLLQLHAPAICFSGSSRLPFDRPETLQTLPQASEATTLTATCPAICFSGSSSLPFASPQNPPNAPLQLPIYMLLPNSYTYMPLPSVFQGVQDCRLPGLKPPKRFRRPPRQQLLQLHAPAICFSGSSRLPFDRPETFQTLPQASKATTLTATCPCHPCLFFREFKTAV